MPNQSTIRPAKDLFTSIREVALSVYEANREKLEQQLEQQTIQRDTYMSISRHVSNRILASHPAMAVFGD